MKTKQLLIFLILSLCILSCNSQTKQNNENHTDEIPNKTTDVITIDGKNYTQFKTPEPTTDKQVTKQLDIKFYDIKDTNNGQTISSVPLPGDWQQQTSGDYQFIGPNDMKIYGLRSGNFSFSDDPQQLYLFRSVGKKIASPKSMDQIIREDFETNAAQFNRKLKNTYPLPEAAAFLKTFNDLQYKIDLTPVKYEAVGTEWEDPDGTSYMTIIVKHEEQGPTADSWGYAFDFIKSSKANFEQAKRTLINYMINQEINMDWIRRVNDELKEKIDRSNLEHQKMMAEVKHNMEVFQEGQAARRADREELDNRISNYILGKSEVINPQTGTTSKVDAGSTYYWINEKGEYITTESYSWNPNEYEPYKKYHTWTRSQLKN
ncbi:MAG: hypothetical protein ABIO60_01830 [Aquaticitalea sp.]